ATLMSNSPIDDRTTLPDPAAGPAQVIQHQPAAPPFVARFFGKYLLQARLGRGGMGEVYQAYDTKIERAVALKVIRRADGKPPRPEEVRQFQMEVKAVAKLDHPRIIPV